ncbi:cullin-2-like [Clavelina lepadiformis]|uniref:Cullin family profile domain-containing protein n=1 Tax=Clavelina lepadiformis TaxID=159417 RepID=A0ABP0H0T3_CLALP
MSHRRVNFPETWSRLSETIYRVISSLPLERHVWNERFLDVYSICMAYPETSSQELYEATHKLLKEHVTKLRSEVAESSNLLSIYSKHWLTYSQGAKYLDFLYHHFNAHYIKRSYLNDADIEYGFASDAPVQMLRIGELALQTWKEMMIEPLAECLVDQLLTEILNHRNGAIVDDYNTRTVVHSLVFAEEYKKNYLEFYENLFEKRFLRETGNYYRAKANDLLVDSTCSDYMKQVLLLLTEEESRNRKFLYKSSYKKATAECQRCVIFDHVQFLQAGCRQMIRHDAQEDLLHMYMLLKTSTDGLRHMVYELEAHIKETGLELIKGIGDGNVSQIPIQFVDTILVLHKHFHDLIMKLFHGDKHFLAALDRGCTSVVNHHEPNKSCRAPELVCRFCDTILKKCSKGMTDDADEKLKSCITVFRYIDDKDVFQKFYSRQLAKRLIHNNCVMDMEELMINRFKDVCGYDFTSKLHSMYLDIRMSAENTKKFHESLQAGDSLNTTMNANILQAGAWPLNAAQVECMLPEVLLQCVQSFELFYNKQYNGRNLTWLHHLSQAEVRMQTNIKPYIISMSTYQLAIVLLFNEASELTEKEMTVSTHLQDRDLERNLSPLLDAKILLKKDEVQPIYVVNEAMTNKRTRFKVVVAQTQREQVTEVQQTHHSVEEDRKLYLQAAIVRIMKARKTIHHNQLIEEVITRSRTRFTPSISAIKRSIESLIEKSYLERAADSSDTYRYLA